MPAARKRTVARQKVIDLQSVMKDYLLNRSMRERSEYYEGALKKTMMDDLEVRRADSAELDVPLMFTSFKSGKPSEKKVTGCERRERKSTTLNTEKAMALIKRKKLTEECTETVVVVSEDAILAANYRGEITDKELAGLYEESTTYAFILTEE